MKILIVDDDESMREVMRITLAGLGHQIHEVGNGIDALKSARAECPDLVILDVMMPGVDGYEICYLIKTTPELRHTRVILFTIRDQEVDIVSGKGALADAYLVKPFEPDKLLAAIARLQAGESGPYPTVGSSDPTSGEK